MLNSIFVLISLSFLISCGLGDKDSPGLYYLGSKPLIISVGDTSQSLSFKRVYIKDYIRGRLATDEDYEHVTLESGDSSKVGIHGLRVIGIDTTILPVIVTADDDSGDFFTDFQVEVNSP